MPLYFWGSGEQFHGFGEHDQSIFMEQGEIFRGAGEIMALFSGSKEALTTSRMSY